MVDDRLEKPDKPAGPSPNKINRVPYKPYDERKAAFLEELKKQREKAAKEPVRCWNMADLMTQAFPPPPLSSVDRLLAIPIGSWSPQIFRDAANSLTDESIQCSVYESGQRPPRLTASLATSKYGAEYEDAIARTSGNRKIAVAVEEGKAIGFGIGCQKPNESVFEFLQIEKFCLRRSGLRAQITIGGQVFGVGIGHLIVAQLMSTLAIPISVNAENSASAYIFRSLGFAPPAAPERPGELSFQG